MLHIPLNQPRILYHPVKSPLHPQPTLHSTSDLSPALWDIIRRKLATEWCKRARQFSRRKRGVVSLLATTKAVAKSLRQKSRSLQVKADLISGDLELQVLERGHLLHPRQQRESEVVSMEGYGHRTASAEPEPSNREHRPEQPPSRPGKPPEQYVADRRREAVDAVMAVFNRWLNTRLAVISHVYEAAGGAGDPPGGEGGGVGPSAGAGRAGRSSTGRAKRQFSGDDGHEDGAAAGGDGDGGDGRGDGQGRGGNKRARVDAEERRFACPFFQHDPRRHSTHRSCIGPGWPTIHRLKEHLTRIHRLPKHTCPRCQQPMSDASELEAHLRADIPCAKRDKIHVQGIDDAQERKIKERKKTSDSLTEEQKWKNIYMILFPDANKNALPSPYYNTQDPAALARSAVQWKSLRKHIEKELPRAVRQKVEHRFENVEAQVLDSLPDIVRTELFHLFRGFTGKSPSASPSPGPASRAASRAATPKASPRVAEADESKNLSLDYYLNDPDLPLSFLGMFGENDFNQQFDPHLECQSDSGYASNGTVPAGGDLFDWS